VRENVEVPLWLSGCRGGLSEERADQALGSVGLMHRSRYEPSLLSGGERQRVAIARALASDSPILLADEPTGNLDRQNGMQVMSTLRDLATEHGKAVLVVTHDARYARFADRVYHMEDGKVRQA
jgi:putative ABC transport system ATP-binding protein